MEVEAVMAEDVAGCESNGGDIAGNRGMTGGATGVGMAGINGGA